jgi:hypothetical protein
MDTEITKLVAEWRAAHEAARKASDTHFSLWRIECNDPELAAARKRTSEMYAVAREAYDTVAGDAEKRIRAVESEAHAALQAVYAKHAVELDRDRAIVEQARAVLREQNAEADKVTEAARAEIKTRTGKAAEEARKAERDALVALVRAVAGGPITAPIPFKYGTRRDFDFRCPGGIRLNYRLHNRREGRLPSAYIVASFDVPTPTGTTRLGINTDYVSGETLQEALQKAEEAAIAEGWLRRGGVNEGVK